MYYNSKHIYFPYLNYIAKKLNKKHNIKMIIYSKL